MRRHRVLANFRTTRCAAHLERIVIYRGRIECSVRPWISAFRVRTARLSSQIAAGGKKKARFPGYVERSCSAPDVREHVATCPKRPGRSPDATQRGRHTTRTLHSPGAADLAARRQEFLGFESNASTWVFVRKRAAPKNTHALAIGDRKSEWSESGTTRGRADFHKMYIKSPSDPAILPAIRNSKSTIFF